MKTPWHVWVVGALATLWNAFGAFDYVMTKTKNEAYLAHYTPEQVVFFTNLPFLYSLLWAVAIWLSVAGSIMILLRLRWAKEALVLAYVAMLGSFSWGLAMKDAPEMDMAQMIMTGTIIVIGGLLAWYATAMAKRGVLK